MCKIKSFRGETQHLEKQQQFKSRKLLKRVPENTQISLRGMSRLPVRPWTITSAGSCKVLNTLQDSVRNNLSKPSALITWAWRLMQADKSIYQQQSELVLILTLLMDCRAEFKTDLKKKKKQDGMVWMEMGDQCCEACYPQCPGRGLHHNHERYHSSPTPDSYHSNWTTWEKTSGSLSKEDRFPWIQLRTLAERLVFLRLFLCVHTPADLCSLVDRG